MWVESAVFGPFSQKKTTEGLNCKPFCRKVHRPQGNGLGPGLGACWDFLLHLWVQASGFEDLHAQGRVGSRPREQRSCLLNHESPKDIAKGKMAGGWVERGMLYRRNNSSDVNSGTPKVWSWDQPCLNLCFARGPPPPGRKLWNKSLFREYFFKDLGDFKIPKPTLGLPLLVGGWYWATPWPGRALVYITPDPESLRGGWGETD